MSTVSVSLLRRAAIGVVGACAVGAGWVGIAAVGTSPAEALSVPGVSGVSGGSTSGSSLTGSSLPTGVAACATPVVSSVATGAGQHVAAPGATVYVTGTNLSGSLCSTSVTVAGTSVSPSAESAGQVQFTMPAGVVGGAVQVTVTDALGDATASNSNLNVVAPPRLSGLSTTTPAEGANLVATGAGFDLGRLSAASTVVSYCGGAAEAADVLGDGQLGLAGPAAYCDGPVSVTFTVPYDSANTASAPIVVRVPAGSIDVAPVVDSVSPGGAVRPGDVVTVAGSGFGSAGSAAVGGVTAQTRWSDGAVTVTVPEGAGSGPLQLVRADGTLIPAGSLTVAGSVPASSGPGSSAGGPVPSSPDGGLKLADAAANGVTATIFGSGRTVTLDVAARGPVMYGESPAVLAGSGGAAASGISGSSSSSASGPTGSVSTGGPVYPGIGRTISGGTSAPRIAGLAFTHPGLPLLPLPWLLLLIALLLVAALAGPVLLRRRWLGGSSAGAGIPGSVPNQSVAWRWAGYLTAGLLALTYLLTATSVLMTLLTEWLPGTSSATLPGGRLYKATAIILSVLLSGIAVRYVYYYRCWMSSRRYFAKPRAVDRAVLASRLLPHLKFQVTTRGGALTIVERTVGGIVEIAAANPWLAPYLSIEVITESVEEAIHLPRRFAGANVDVHGLALPVGYRTPNGTGLKARAMHYMVERRLAGWNAKPGRTFIVHLDEETLVTEEHLMVLVDYLSDDPRPVSQGPILYPLEWDQAPWMCRAMESLRPFGCSECARVMSNPPPPHLHGSNLVVDEEVENRIGWDFGTIDGQPYIAEDLIFGLRAFSMLGKEGFGWHGATMLEQPPLSVYWAIQQRLRWVLGALQGWRAMGQRDDLRSIPAPERRRLRTAVGFRVATYALGFPIGFAGLFFFLHPAIRQAAISSPVGVWRLLIMLAGVGWVLSYQIGLARNLRYQSLSVFQRVRQHLTVLLLTPISGLFETAGPFIALTRWLIGARQARWTPTPKTSEAPGPDGPVAELSEPSVEGAGDALIGS